MCLWTDFDERDTGPLLTANNDPAMNEIRNGSVHKIEERIYIHNSFLFIWFPKNRGYDMHGVFRKHTSAAIKINWESS